MIAPPVRRLVAAAGLLVLAPVGIMLALGSLSPEDAALRAVATLVVCMAVGRGLTVGLRSLLTAHGGSGPEDGSASPRAVLEEDASDQRGSPRSAASMTAGSNADPAP